ncbi:MAG: hypothetical protein Q9M43_11830 [Sulfurimonas sp.]|nr:hypothetical protein [Sulfurimonas sp.]
MFKILLTIILFFGIGLQADDTKKYSQEKLEQMLAPIALYPDALYLRYLWHLHITHS